MIQPEHLQQIATFMQRTRLEGSEVEAFSACMKAIQEEYSLLMTTAKEEKPSDPEQPSS